MSRVRGADEPLNVLIISDQMGFPEGFAATQRARLMSMALLEAGVKVGVLLLRPSEVPPLVVNSLTSGSWRGVQFEYATGTTVRSERFATRRWAEARGLAGALGRIVSGRRNGQLDCVYLWMDYWEPRSMATLRMLRGACSALGVRVVVELNEPSPAVWMGAPLSDGAGSRDPLLAHVDGFVAISGGLDRWVRTRHGGMVPHVARIPVLVDPGEMRPSFTPAARSDAFYSCSPEYPDEIRFVLDASESVRERYPDFRVRFSGWEIDDLASAELRGRLRACAASGLAVAEGVMPRERLLEAYRESAMLLLPMRDDPRSRARCPTKLGEYLASGRAVVATGIGEVGELLTSGEDVFLAEPGSARAFAEAMGQVLADPGRASAVGRRGRATAERLLGYSNYSALLREFFETVCSGAVSQGRDFAAASAADSS